MRSFRNLFVLLFALSSLASATVVTYTCTTPAECAAARASWDGATTGISMVDFESLSLPLGYQSYSDSSGLTLGGLNFTGLLSPGYFLYALNPPSGADENFGTGTLLRGPEYGSSGASYLRVILPTGVTSFSVDLMTYAPAASSFRIQLDSIDVAIVSTQARPNPTFFGVTSDAPISEVRIYLNSGSFVTQGLFDNFAYGTAGSGGGPEGETPEVATMLAVGSGLMMIRWMGRRNMAAAPAAA